jgi:OmpA-OmpF porin, OOP family
MKKIQLVIFLFSALFSTAQTADKKWNIGLHGGAMQYNGDLGNGFYKTDILYGFGGISISRFLGNRVDLSLFVTKGEVGYVRSAPNDSLPNFRAALSTATVNVRFNILGADAFIRPYLFVGGGALVFDKNYTVNKSTVNYAIPSFGGGINVRLAPAIMLQIQETFMLSDNDGRDGDVSGSGNDMFLFHSVGITFNAGKKKDADGDGVADRKDKCPDTPTGVPVDENGCQFDKDNDKVYDSMDECPDVAGIVELKGCPDKDLDGIADKNDRCPDAKGSTALFGCPDTDKDGIADVDDKCPATDEKYKVDSLGCPFDNDSDEVLNEDDACPDQSGPASLKGCPDSDNDGVADNEDRCPQISGTVNNKGCPEIAKEDVKRITQIASKIFFETNSDKLKVASLVQLDDLVDILNKYPQANIEIEGHTDDVGSDEYNQQLSQKRTESVKKYLTGKGIAETRLTATGFGETKPIADNKTSVGRAKNRRVELKTSY